MAVYNTKKLRPISRVCSLVLLFVTITIGNTLLNHSNVQAVSATNFNAGHIIDDAVFVNANSMSAQDIQTFLNSKVPSCDTNGTQIHPGTSITNAQYAANAGWPGPPYTCLKNYTENNQTSAQILYNIAQQYQINPQTLIVLLQKEQGLVTDTWPLNTQYKTATGYGCPDTAPCDSQYYGLTNQLTWSAKMFRAIMNASSTWYTPYVLGSNYIQWNPNASCGGSNVNIDNRSTQALYNYTPYQPNQAALNAGYGAGDNCSASGNRNFYLYFSDWFGSTTGPDNAWSPISTTIYTDNGYTQPAPLLNGRYYLQASQKAYVKIISQNIGRTTWSNTNTRIGTYGPFDYASPFADASWIGPNRPVAMTETPVAPNQTATFKFSINAPSQFNGYLERYAVVREGVTWITNTSITLPIYVPKPVPTNELSTNASLGQGNILNQEGSLSSPEQHSILRISPSGNLELYTNFIKTWESGTSGSNATHLTSQGDGNVVLYTNSNKPVWSSGTASASATVLTLQADGNLVLANSNGAVWSTNTTTNNEILTANQNILPSQTLLHNQSISSPDRRYKFYLQSDGNLVLYSSTHAVWSSNTFGQKVDRLTLQGDGNMVLYDTSNKPIWSSGTFGQNVNLLEMQQDGNLVMYNPSHAIWTTSTYMAQ